LGTSSPYQNPTSPLCEPEFRYPAKLKPWHVIIKNIGKILMASIRLFGVVLEGRLHMGGVESLPL